MERISRLLFEHRRLVAAVVTGLAVVAAISAVRPTTGEGRPVVVARHDLASGHVVTSTDLRTSTVSGRRPSHALTRREAVGRRVAGPMRAGEAVTDYRVLRPGALAGYGDGAVLTTVRVDRADGLTGLRVADHVDVVAVDPDGETEARVVARDVEVATLPPASDDSDVITLGIVTTEQTALDLARASLTARFSVLASAG